MAPEETAALRALYTMRFGRGTMFVAPNCIHWFTGICAQGEVRKHRGRWVAAWFERHSMTYNHSKLCADSLAELVKLGAPTFKTPLEALQNDSR